MKKRVDVVLATYNGERYLEAQLDSLLKTENINYINSLVVSDDSSNDSTLNIVSAYTSLIDLKVVTNKNERGPVGNFFYGLQQTKSDYVMFCDQDDVWDSDKIGAFLAEAEQLHSDKPGVVYSDLRLVDSNLNQLGSNFFENEKIPPYWGTNVQNLLFQNVSPGCAMLINRACVDRLTHSYNNHILMHDWWALLFGALYKNVRVINRATLSYRQHENNAVGASSRMSLRNIKQLAKKSYLNLFKTLLQAKAFLSYIDCYEKDFSLNSHKSKNILGYDRSLTSRIKLAATPAKLKSTLIRDMLTRFFILFFKNVE